MKTIPLRTLQADRKQLIPLTRVRPFAFYLLLLIYGFFFASSCKKEVAPTAPPEPTVPRTTEQLVSDSIYFYFKQQSYWTSSVENANPISAFTDRFFATNADLITNARSILNAMKAQTPFHAGYNGPLDRFSFVEETSAGGTNLRADRSDGYGIFETLARVDAAPVAHIYISFVEGGSPAARVGIQRGDKIVGINENRNLEVPLSNDGTILSRTAINLVAEALESPSFTIVVERAGVIISHELQYGNYEIDPLVADTIYTLQGRKIGYFALSSFEQTRTSSGTGTPFRAKLDGIFSRFNSEQVQDIIVDFRYNVGGYVHAAEYLANHLINTEGDRQLMYKSDTNPALRQGRYAREFDDVNFVKSTTLNPRKLYFLIGNNTASASELVISALQAYYNPNGNQDAGSRRMEIIGSQQAVKPGTSTPSTYGKPMGFFPETIMNRVDLWAASFKIINARGYTDYWDGIPATYPTPIQDNILYNFGDPRESMTFTALFHSLNNAYPATTQARAARNTTGNSNGIEIVKELHPRAPRELKKYK
ncbi:S41 family peptidase [Sphingobacterium sp. lm-10]|uniref:S41 family peptidase n=1 Tax=Sphingobacterium sp. lm-10 TaxID=2944904 RepID=UPI0020217974|nr:S41 family peptidase [Sphingobacterium sp. lm-10]MCL7988139.1 S41 family peptidase [Sphingobacterium sp. lm-10]